MKYLSEYRDQQAAKQLLSLIEQSVSKPCTIMEICGGQTHSLVRNGIIDMLPKEITMVHGPGCPVCVTPPEMIDHAIELALHHDVVICSFGDMLRVPGSSMSLQQAKAQGGDIRIVYSPLEAAKLAEANPSSEVVFFAVGFETTAPANALSVYMAKKLGLKNFSLLVSHVLVPPAMVAILSDEECQIDAFLAAGHVCTVMGYDQYHPITEKFKIPIVVTGFEPVDLLKGILSAVKQLNARQSKVENQYERVVTEYGNPEAKKVIYEVFEIKDRNWRGIGSIPESGFELNRDYQQFDAIKKFRLSSGAIEKCQTCIAGSILKGQLKPSDCPEFGKGCTPANPLGAPMVSSEGACAAYFNYHNENVSAI